MTPYHADHWLTIYGGDCREVMRELPAESVHCVITSPPYWGLRDYGTATWDGGDAGCDHLGPPRVSASTTIARSSNGTGRPQPNAPSSTLGVPFRATCGKCGARRIDAQLGLEATPDEYVAAMVDVFREVRRVLRSDGTVWLNLGDSYAGGATNGEKRPGSGRADGIVDDRAQRNRNGIGSVPGLKPKDLVGIPWRVAFALQADGWYLRSDIVWSKPNPMPESVTDRPTKAHEYVFLLSKSARYFYDADAVREAHDDKAHPGMGLTRDDAKSPTGTTGKSQGWNGHGLNPTFRQYNPAGRNLRSVWTIATAPYPGAHFATFPPKLVEPCVKAGCPEGGTVLDPFAGTGTVGLVAQQLSRRAVLIDLNPEYLAQCLGRNRQMPLGVGS